MGRIILLGLVLGLAACDSEDPPDGDAGASTDGGAGDALVGDAITGDAAASDLGPRLDATVDGGAGGCLTSEDCGAGAFCELLEGLCDGAESPGLCLPIPPACPEDEAPVCGCDGVTYGNDCQRRTARVALDRVGPCAPECEPGDVRRFACPDGAMVPWCQCSARGAWVCTDSPENLCRDRSCDDGTMPVCPLPEPECPRGQIAAVQNGCWSCVLAETCLGPNAPGCMTDAECAPDAWCDPCARSSCPECDDCIAGCAPHGCPTEAEPQCNALRPECPEGQTAVVREGCWLCVERATCEPVTECAAAGGYCAHFMDECRAGFAGGPPMGCPLGRSGQCCLPAAECVAEGESGPVVPGAPPCCEGLEAIGCESAEGDACEPCAGAFVCARCGDGRCGPGENRCNCAEDCAPAMGECQAPADCIPRFWNVRCMGHWSCDGGRCQEVCDFEGCGDGQCDRAAGESRRSCRPDCGEIAECRPPDAIAFACPDGSEVPWCECTDAEEWRCVLDPEQACRDTSCDDGTQPICDLIPPVCGDHEIFAWQDRCYRCVNPLTCLPWGQPECRDDRDCAGERCDDCASSSCPACDDCVAACVPR